MGRGCPATVVFAPNGCLWPCKITLRRGLWLAGFRRASLFVTRLREGSLAVLPRGHVDRGERVRAFYTPGGSPSLHTAL